MQDFVFNNTTKIIFGKDSEKNICKEIKKLGSKKVFIVYGSGSVKESGLLEKTEKLLKDENIEYLSFGGVRANPSLEHAEEGIKEAIDFNADFILAIGGGSVIDTAKAIAHAAANKETYIWDFFTNKQTVLKSIPIGCILTISASGSEMSDAAVLTNKSLGEKRILHSDFNRPLFAVMNPYLTMTLPYYQIACGIADMMMHTLDRYFGYSESINETTDAIAEAILRTTIKNGSIAMKDKNNYDAMSELMWLGSLSHNGLTWLGNKFDFITHRFADEIGAEFDTAHGASLTSIWGSWTKYCYKDEYAEKRFIQYSKNVWNIDDDTGIKGIEKTIEYFKEINMPVNFSELGIGIQNDEVLNKLTDKCMLGGDFNYFVKFKRDDVYNIFKMSNV